MRLMMKKQRILLSSQRGVSLIELMVALLIGFLLALGIVQIFGASRSTYQVQEGLSRVQESGRFAVQFLERQLRMVGYMGCGADTERNSQASFVNHLALYSAAVPGGDAVDAAYRFQRPLEAFSSDDLPGDLAGLDVMNGTDVLVLRVFGEDSVPVISVAPAADNYKLDITVSDGNASVFTGTNGGPVVYAMQTCRSADVFVGTQAGTTLTVIGNAAPNQYLDPTVQSCNPGGNCPWDFRISNAFLNAPAGGLGIGGPQLNAQIHRGEYYVIWVGNDAVPSLHMKRLKRDNYTVDDAEELVEGVENLQVRFGVDTDGDGQVNEYRTAADVATAADNAGLDANWRQVVSVRVGLLIRSPDPADVSGQVGGADRTYQVLDTTVTPADPNDSAMRQVYETTVALRNRIFNS